MVAASASSSPPQPEGDHPLATARDRIQASAREMMRNLEAAMQNAPSSPSNKLDDPPPSNLPEQQGTGSSSLEHAFRLFFSSCTTGATTVLAEDDDDVKGHGNDDDDTAADLTPVSTLPSSRDSASSLSSSTPPPPTLTKKNAKTNTQQYQQQPSNPINNSRSLSAPPRRNTTTAATTTVVRTRSSNHDVFRDDEPKLSAYCASSTPPIANHVYEQLFLDEQHREAHAVPRRSPLLPTTSRGNDIDMDDASSNNSNAIIIQHAQQCDDEISAISAHTLEAMAYLPFSFHPRSAADGASERHLSLTASQGDGSLASSVSAGTFDQWQQAEQSYWAQQMVRKERRARRRQRMQQVQEMAEI